jgi:dynein heavy chain
MLNLLIKHGKPTVFIGGTGTGKTIAVNRFLRTLEPSQYDSTIICFSAKSSANITQETIQSKLEKRNRRLLGPPANKKFVIFVDDLNMPTVEKNGA